MSPASHALYLYGVLPAAEQGSVSVEGVDGSQVETIEYDGVAALASRIQGSALSAARGIRAHWRVLQAVAEKATVLPIRFGTVLESEAAVRAEFLEPNARHLVSLLEQLAGCVQLTVKGEYREPEVIDEVVRSSPGIAALAKRVRSRSPEAGYYDRIRLGEAIAAQIARLRDADTARAMELLAPAAVAAHVEEPGANGAFNLSFLVRRDGQDEFTGRVNSLIDQTAQRIDLRYVGPLPPYSFTGDASGVLSWA